MGVAFQMLQQLRRAFGAGGDEQPRLMDLQTDVGLRGSRQIDASDDLVVHLFLHEDTEGQRACQQLLHRSAALGAPRCACRRT